MVFSWGTERYTVCYSEHHFIVHQILFWYCEPFKSIHNKINSLCILFDFFLKIDARRMLDSNSHFENRYIISCITSIYFKNKKRTDKNISAMENITLSLRLQSHKTCLRNNRHEPEPHPKFNVAALRWSCNMDTW